jgi:hypothetical protein
VQAENSRAADFFQGYLTARGQIPWNPAGLMERTQE